MKADIAIIGGGIVGSAIAYFLARDGRAGTVAVIEPDPTYARAATPAGAGGVRRLFSLPENIALSRFSLDFYAAFAETMAVDGEPAAIAFTRQGYLFVAGQAGAAQLEANFRLQASLGVPAELLDAGALGARFPSVETDDVALAVHSPGDGWIDPHGALMGFRRKALALGAVYVEDRVRALDTAGGVLRAARLSSGDRVEAAVFVNAAGAWAGEVAAMAAMPLPVVPMTRLQHYFEVRQPLEPLPLVKDESGMFFRPEGAGYVGGVPRWDISPGFNYEPDGDYFERAVWPLLARRVPAFEAVRERRAWAGHYAQNTLDGNAILGPWAGGLDNFHVAGGFSGHGIMHAPAVGLAMAELVLDGAFTTLDLTRFSHQRVIAGAPYPERGII